MRALTAQLQDRTDLSPADVERSVAALLSPGVPDSDKAAFLRALREKGESAAEIAAFAREMLARALDPEIIAPDGPIIDVCGTGGDQLEVFNVSTATMFILAAAGAVVVKHGNRAITSKCGGADVLEELGVNITLNPEALRRCVTELGVGFLFAPAYHPAFKAIVPVRKALAAEGIPTIFNILGPLLNPARPSYQLVGVYDAALLPKYGEALAALGRARAWAVHGSGMDELSLTGPSQVREVIGGVIRQAEVDPETLGLKLCTLPELRGGDRTTNARILTEILAGSERGPKRDLVLLNAAAGFVIIHLAADLAAGLELAREQIANGAALAKLRAMAAFR